MVGAAVAPILVVDDDLTFVGFVRATLEKLGVPSAVALTGTDAIRYLTTANPAGVLLDLRLPDMDGLDVLRSIRERGNPVPVAVLTGAGTIPAAVGAIQLGAMDFLEKPVRLVRLSRIVSRLLSAHSPQPTAHSPQPTAHSPTGPVTGRDALVDRLVSCMISVVTHNDDVPTVVAWCEVVGKSKSSLSALCAMVGVAPKAALDLARLLRATGVSHSSDVCDAFLVADPRTAQRLLRRAGIGEGRSLSPQDFLANQRLILDRRVIERLTDCLHRR